MHETRNRSGGGADALPDSRLNREGIDPQRAALHRLGWPRHLLWHGYPPWTRPMIIGLVLWAAFLLLELLDVGLPVIVRSVSSLLVGLLILRTACDALITAAEHIAARKRSYFLPKNHQGRFVMPRAVTEAGSQLLIAGAGLGSILGFVMLVLVGSSFPKQAFAAGDLIVLGLLMLGIFGVYLAVLIRGYASEERAVREALELTNEEVAQRRSEVYEEITKTAIGNIVLVLGLGVAAAVIGGERVSDFDAAGRGPAPGS